MSNQIKKVVKFEILRQIKKPSFWIAILAGPIMVAGIFGLSFLNGQGIEDSIKQNQSKHTDSNIGIFDESNYFNHNINQIISANDSDVKLKTFTNEFSGLNALRAKEISVFYYIPKDFNEKLTIKTYTPADDKLLSGADGQDFLKSLIFQTITKGVSPIQMAIITGKYNFERQFIDLETGKETNPFGKAIIPIAILAILYLFIVVFGNRLFMTVVEEKETRISEMLLTSVSAKHLIIGKIISTMIIGIIFIFCLLTPAVTGIILNREMPMIKSVLSSIQLEPIAIITNIALLFISIFFFTCTSTIVGALTSTAREASQYGGIMTLGVMLPFFFIGAFTAESATLTTHVITIFPLSTPVSLMFRNAFGNIPQQELILYTALLLIYAIIACAIAISSFKKHAINFSAVKLNLLPKKTWTNKK